MKLATFAPLLAGVRGINRQEVCNETKQEECLHEMSKVGAAPDTYKHVSKQN